MEFNNISLQKTNGKMIPIPSGPKSSAFAGERLRPLASKIPQEDIQNRAIVAANFMVRQELSNSDIVPFVSGKMYLT